MTTAMTSEAAKLQSDRLMPCLTCPLCDDLFTHATTISECLHTFCRDCIYEKIRGDELERCPVCNTNLGCVPLEKLRADHTMDDLREKIFPCKRRKVKAPETTVHSVVLPYKRKERSLSSLAITETNTAPHPGPKTLSKSAVRKNFTAQQCPPNPTMIDDTNLIYVQDKQKQNDTRVMEMETDVSNQRIQGEASVARSNDCNIQGQMIAKPNPLQIDDKDVPMPGPTVQEHGHKLIMDRVESGLTSATSGSIKHGNLQYFSRGRRLEGTNGFYVQAKGDIDMDRQCSTLPNPIWFSLVASDHQEGNEPLPQISSSYLRVRDGSVPVSFIQKYLVKKLGLPSEIEVEISMKGQPVSSTMHLHDVIDLWRQTTAKIERIQIPVGSSAKDFVMVLSYGRKAHPLKTSQMFVLTK